MLFRGTCPAIVTPFNAHGEVDYGALRRLLDYQIAGGIDAVVILGTTGENPTVTSAERQRLVETSVERVAARVPVIVGTGGNDTRQSVDNARHAIAAGADGQLVVGPYYNKPTQAGFRAHVDAIASASELPIVLYNVPGRTSLNILPETILELAERVDTVVGVKEASGSLAQISDILARRPDGFAVYAGDDEMALPVCVLGGDGVVSVIANALPEAFGRLVRDALDGRITEARRSHYDLLEAMRACFAETNPIPIKAVLADVGLIENVLRLPLMPITDASRHRVIAAFERHLGVGV